MSSKQDRTYTRTASDLERKLNLKERFSSVMGVAEDAQRAAGEVLDSMVGANILTGTKDFSGDGWVGLGLWFDDGKYNGLTVKSRVGAWQALKQYINVIAGEVYTISAYVKSTARFSFACDAGNTGTGEANTSKTYYDACTNWTRISNTFTVTETGTIAPGFESIGSGDQLWICGMKIEKGNKATEWSPSPLDNDVLTHEKVFNALTENGQFQGIYRGDDGDVYINASYIMAGVLDASVVTIANLVVKVLQSVLGSSRLDVDGAEIKLTEQHGITFDLKNWEDGTCYMYMHQYNSNGTHRGSSQLGALRLQLGGNTANPTFAVFANDDGTTDLKVGGAMKTVSWKANGDGTYTLIGT